MDARQKFQQDLNRLLKGTRRWVLLQGLSRTLAVAGPMFLLTVFTLGGPTHPGTVLTSGLVVSLAAAVLALFWNQVVKPLHRLRRSKDMVGHVEQLGQFSNLLVAAEESLRLPGRWSEQNPVQKELQKRIFTQATRILGWLSPRRIAPYPHQRLSLVALVLTFVGAGVLFGGGGQTRDRGLARLFDPWPATSIPATKGLYPEQGSGQVVAGGSVSLKALDFAGGRGSAVCEIKVGQGLWQPVATEAGFVPRVTPYLRPPYKSWAAQVENAREDFVWRYRRGSLVSAEQKVTVRHYPLLTELGARIIPPQYTGLSDQQLDRLPAWLEVPAGSTLSLQGTANHELAAAVLATVPGDSLVMHTDSLKVAGDLTVQQDLSFSIHLRDGFALSNQDPLTYEISALPDAEPEVSLVREADDGQMPLDGLVMLRADAADDYGLVALSFQIRVKEQDDTVADGEGPAWLESIFWDPSYPDSSTLESSRGQVSLENTNLAEGAGNLRVQLGLEVDFSRLQLAAGDVLEIRLGALDNRRPGSGQLGHSRVLRLALPSAADVLASQAEASEQRRGELEEARRRGQELGADLDRLNRELMKNPIPDWARQQEMKQAIERQKGLQEELSRLASELQKDLDRLAAGQMTSENMLQKAEEVSQLLSQSPQESLQNLLEKMEQAGQMEGSQVSPQEMAKAIRDVAQNQKDMARRLDAALAMIKRMEQEQDMEGLASLLEQMIRKQQELADLSRQLAQQKKDDEAADQAENESDLDGDSPQEGESAEGENSEADGQQQDGQDPNNQDPNGQDQNDQTQNGQEQSGQDQQGEENTPDAEELARLQEALAEELEQLQEQLAEAMEKLKEEQERSGDSQSNQNMEQALKEAMEKLEKQMQEGGMQEASKQLSEMDPEQAAQLQQQALRDLGSLYHVILQSQQAMQMAMEQNQMSSLRGLAADLLAISARQEEILARVPSQLRDVRSQGLTRGQHRLQRATTGVRDELTKLLDESPTRIMKLLGRLDGLIEQMGYVVEAMEDNRAPVARRNAKTSLAEANRIVIGLLTEAQINSQSNSGSSGDPQQSLSQQLKSMAQDQAQLNSMTEQLRQMLANRGMSQEARSQMKRLGEAQGDLAGRLEELEQEERQPGEGERLLGDLGSLGEQMERISGELDQGLVSEETLVRQERILSRLLDARNSVRRRDYTMRRESRTADDLFREQLGTVAGDDSQDPDGDFRLRYQALEKAPLEYRELVRRYFTALDSLRRLGPEDFGDMGLPLDKPDPEVP